MPAKLEGSEAGEEAFLVHSSDSESTLEELSEDEVMERKPSAGKSIVLPVQSSASCDVSTIIHTYRDQGQKNKK